MVWAKAIFWVMVAAIYVGVVWLPVWCGAWEVTVFAHGLAAITMLMIFLAIKADYLQ